MSFQTLNLASSRIVRRIPFSAVIENLRESAEFREAVGIPQGAGFDADRLAMSYSPAVYQDGRLVTPACIVATYEPAGGLAGRAKRGRKPGSSKKSSD